ERVVAIDRDGLLIGDTLFDRVRRLEPQSARTLTLSAGDGQSGLSGTKLTISVKVVDSNGLVVSNVPVTFAVTTGTATLTASTVSSGGDGISAAEVTLGATPGPVVVTASSAGVSPVTFKLTINPPPVTGNLPKILTGGVASAGLGVPKVLALVPLGIATAFGTNFAPAGTFKKVGGSDLVNGAVPTQFAGVCVLTGGVRAPMVSVTGTQVSFQVPILAAGSKVEVRVIAQCGTPAEAISDAELVPVQASGPEFFPAVGYANGHNPIAATDAVTGAYIGIPNLIPGGSFTPGMPNQDVALYATGFGETSTGLKPGEIPLGLHPLNQPFTLTINGKEIPAGNISYVGVAPFSPGLYQVNVHLPADTPDGDLPVVITVGGVSSSPFAYITVKAQPAADASAEKHPVRRRGEFRAVIR
ncbi:MAG: hypothetical protein ABI823_05450, partial [Bryobacteraceae bacterium]